MPTYTVKEGDCLSSIAAAHGFAWQTLWNHADNAELKRRRKDPNVLCPGDEVVIPERKSKTESGATETRHRFRVTGGKTVLRLRLLKEGESRAHEPYKLDIDGEWYEGTTDGDGQIEQKIPADAKKGKLLLGEKDSETIELNLGGVDPVDEVKGIQQRLKNLGLPCGKIDGELGEKTQAALKRFQQANGLEATGQADQATKDKLVELHGC